MLKKVLSTCVVTCVIVLSAKAQTFDYLTLQHLNMGPSTVPLGIQLTTTTPNLNQMATGFVGLHRKNYMTKSYSGNDLTDEVGIWIKGYYQGYGAAMPVFLGGNGYNSEFASMTVDGNGNVGIGMTNPTAKLEVGGDVYLSTPNWNDSAHWATTKLQYFGHSLVIGSKPGNWAHNVLELMPGGANEGILYSHFNMYTALKKDSQEVKIHMGTDGYPTFFNGGNVGIGTKNPLSLLSVKGEITAQKVRVTATGWADFVFASDYNLPSLQGVAAFIKEHQHLPEIPSAATVEKEGIELGEMNKKLLQKIEELTLYIIQQDKQLAAVQERLKKLEEKN